MADVSKLFYKDKSARGLSWVHIFIKVTPTPTHKDTVTGRRAAHPAHNNKRSVLLLWRCQAVISARCKEDEVLNEKKTTITGVGGETWTESRSLPLDPSLFPGDIQ